MRDPDENTNYGGRSVGVLLGPQSPGDLSLASGALIQGDRFMRTTLLAAFLAGFAGVTSFATEIVAHRGASQLAPENTLAAFKLAWEQGADACEMDLRLSSDGEIVVIHDQDTRRTTGVSSVVAQTSLVNLQQLSARAGKGDAYASERIPTLAQALAVLPPGKRYFLEIKCGPEILPVLERQLAAWKPNAAQIAIITFDPDLARRCKATLPWFKVYRLSSGEDKHRRRVGIDQLIAEAKRDGLDGLHLSRSLPWPQFAKVRAAGLELYVWTVNDRDTLGYFSTTAIDGITTDNPLLAREALK
ncbi:MAG: glycerophosphodiester phosphodiesterase family protein [Rariglobus sp.]